MEQVIPVQELREELNRMMEKLKADLVANVSVRSNPSAIDKYIDVNSQLY